jgi:hypothetical protein
MIQKKICMIGSFAVGKTSLVKRFVESIFSDKYLTTVGVKIDKKVLEVDGRQTMLMLWDLEGQDNFAMLKLSYLRGAAGYLLVADGTRAETLKTAAELQGKVESSVGKVPFLLLVNKSDLAEQWEAVDEDLDKLAGDGWTVLKTSAKTGENVEEAFTDLARRMLA